jgi:sugar lactone lactonase YvrE
MTAKRIVHGSDSPGEDALDAFDEDEAVEDSGFEADEELEPVEPKQKGAATPGKASRRLRLLLAVNLGVLVLLLAGAAYALAIAAAPKGGPTATPVAAILPVATEMEWVRSIYAWGTATDEHLITPNTVAIGPDGAIWTNSRNRYAVAFNPDGSFDRVIMSKPSTASMPATTTPMGPKKPAPKLAPSGVSAVFSLSVDSKNNLYVGDDAEGNVLKFTPEGRLEQGWSVPGLVKVAANDSRVAVVGEGHLGVFTQDTGQPVFAGGTRGQGAQQFDLPLGVHIDASGNVYVADTQNQRVRKYDASGKLLWDAGTVPDRKAAKSHGATSAPTPTGIFELPTGVTVDGNGRVVVVDAFKYQIIVLDGQTGKKIAEYGDFGSADGQFNNPSDIEYDAQRDYFVIADTQNNRLQVVRLPGSSKSPVVAAVVRAADRPIWVLGLPFAFLLVAVPGTSALRHWRRKKAVAA